MRVFLFSPGFDVAGQHAALAAALRRERPRWVVDQMRRLSKFMGYPAQREYDESVARRLWSRADVVHLNVTLARRRRFVRRPLVVHHHGTEYRDHRAAVDAAERAAGARTVVSTLDLVGSPGVEWLPVVADLDWMRTFARQTEGPRHRLIAHSPTDRARKQTDAVLRAAAVLDADLDVIEGVPWTECLARKGRADVFVDQLELGYGLSAVEAWAMGMPVVAGVADPVLRARMVDAFGELPFLEATPGTLRDVVGSLLDSPAARREWGERGREHAERFHSQRAVVERLEGVYEQAIGRAAA